MLYLVEIVDLNRFESKVCRKLGCLEEGMNSEKRKKNYKNL